MNSERRGIAIGVLSVLGSILAIYFCVKHRVLWVLVPIPALVGIMYHLLNLQSRYDNRKKMTDLYQQFRAKFKEGWSRSATASEVSEDAAEDMNAHQPKLSSTIWAAALLTAVLAIPAAMSGGGIDLSFDKDAKPVAGASTMDTALGWLKLRTAPRQLSDADTGLVLAGLGVYAMLILRMIGRVNSGTLHARFMITAALRATVAQVLGFFAGATGWFALIDLAPGKTMLEVDKAAYFLIGLFYPLFVEQLRDKAFDWFMKGKKKPATEPLEVKMIDGVDDDVAEILTELSVTDVQHVASSDPAVLTVRSLYPFERVTDWISQAMLIRRFGDRIAELRKLNMRGIIDWIPLMEPIVNNTVHRADAEAALGQIANVTGEPIEVIRVFGRAVYHDYKTNLLWNLWQHRLDLMTQPAMVPAGPKIPIAGPAGAPVPADVSQIVDRLVQAELERIAVDQATKFKADNPDATVMAPADIQANYDAAYAAALQRATLGANPKPSTRARIAYEQALGRALEGPSAG